MDGGWDRPFYIRGHKLPVNSRLFLQLLRSTLINNCHVNRSYPKTESAVQYSGHGIPDIACFLTIVLNLLAQNSESYRTTGNLNTQYLLQDIHYQVGK